VQFNFAGDENLDLNQEFPRTLALHRGCEGARVNVRFGSKADIDARPADVRFTPNSGHQ
jgi:hypothetical protein